jgi:hypothetical protein
MTGTPEPDQPASVPPDVDAVVRAAAEGAAPIDAALTLAAIANRAIAELNKVARAEANARRGAPDWGAWASLANAARDAALKTATCRKVATELSKRAAPPAESE